MNVKKLLKRILLYLIILLVIILIIYSCVKAHEKIYTGDIKSLIVNKKEVLNNYNIEDDSAITYSEYLARYKDKKIVDEEISLSLDTSNIGNKNFIKTKSGIYTSDKSLVNFTFDVKKEGLYSLFLRYIPVLGTESDLDKLTYDEKDYYRSRTREIQRELKINDTLPFYEAYYIKFGRNWINNGDIFLNEEGNEVRPPQIEKPIERGEFVGDFTNLNTLSYKFYLKEGKNQKLTLNAISEPLFIKEIVFKKEDQPLPYEDAIKKYKDNGYYEYTGNREIKIEGESMLYKSSPVLIPLNDASSSKITPRTKGNKTKLNIMGYYSWRMPGYWIEYEFDAPQKGLYALSFYAKQDLKQGTFSTKEIIINDKIPFLEASHIPFLSSTRFSTYILGSKEKKYLFPLEKGKNKIKMRTSLSNIGNILNLVNDSVNKLNALYIDILTSVPEEVDDVNVFDIETQVPDFKGRIKEIKINLENTVSLYKSIVKNSDSRTSSIRTLIRQLEDFYNYPNGITKVLNSFKTNIAALGSWLNQEMEQPLTVDAFMFHNPKRDVGRIKENFFERFHHQLTKFIYSFAKSKRKGKNKLTVWVTSGRDNAHIIRRLLDDPEEGLKNINVNLELVLPDVLLKAVTSGNEPDIALNVPENVPCDFAFRDVLLDLKEFKDFNNVREDFHPEAFTSLTFKDGIYALPETQTFPVMFYRKDIFKKLGITFTKDNTTYEEFESMLEIMQNKKMNFYLESPVQFGMVAANNVVSTGLYSTFLFQHGGAFYKNDNRNTALLEENAKEAFIKYCEYYSNKDIDIQANFINRFRSGEMPAGIASYDLYNQLAVFAPEISGKWAISSVPSFIRKDKLNGNIKQFAISTNIPQSAIIFKSTKKKEIAWDFLKWWASTNTQLLYGRELETTLGAAARYAAANKNTASLIPWPREDLAVIQLARKRAIGIPQVPGGYMTTRQFKNAFLANVRDNQGTVDVLYNYCQEIDNEIKKKMEEFNIS